MKTTFMGLALIFWLLLVLPAPGATLYVDLNSTNPAPPYADLSIAAVTIQDAVNAATNGDLVLVNDGYYQDGSGVIPQKLSNLDTNCLIVKKPLFIRSLNGPAATFISGSGKYRCVYLGSNATLSGFTLLNGSTGSGGGVSGPSTSGGVLTNCILSGNNSQGYGGGAYNTTLINCILNGNQAYNGGGGAFNCTLLNCIVTGNEVLSPLGGGNSGGGIISPSGVGGGVFSGSAVNCLITENHAALGGGVFDALSLINCTIVSNAASISGGVDLIEPKYSAQNCIIYFNSAGTNANFGLVTNGGTFINCCTLPLPAKGFGNITNEPAFMNIGADDFHPAPSSPVINSGNNAAITNGTDLDGNPRIVGRTVDMGAYEYQHPTSLLSYAWAELYGLPVDGSADFIDSDGDGMNNWQEWVAGTNPTNAASVLALYAPILNHFSQEIIVKWQSVAGKTYDLQRSTNPFGPGGFTSISSNITGQAGSTFFYDYTATNGNTFFYRVVVQ